MDTLKKMLFLSNNEKTKGMGTLKLEHKNNVIMCTLKTYNTIPDGEYILGIKDGDLISKHNVHTSSSTYNFILPSNTNISHPLGCVLLSCQGSQVTPILWGYEKDPHFKSAIISNIKEGISRINTSSINVRKQSSISETIEPTPIQVDIEELHSSITSPEATIATNNAIIHNNQYPLANGTVHDKITDNNQDFSISAQSAHNNYSLGNTNNHCNCQPNEHLNNLTTQQNTQHATHNNYQDLSRLNNIDIAEISMSEEIVNTSDIAAASAQASLFETSDEELDKIIESEFNSERSPHQFYDMIADQIDEIFNRYPREHKLESLVDNSKWAKLDTDTDNKYYVVGIINVDNNIKYICYGVPGTYNQEPPIEMRKYSQWLPTDVRNPYTTGYWVMYQDANTGENIFLNS
ncbi:MAG: hypothetical protein E7356_01500 [Clostridiales bacterium]|nr:hypothetical protein [Clostridiales bacterium]